MLAILFILLIISIKLYIDAPFDIEREFFTYNLIVAFVALLIFMIKKKKIDNPLIHSNLFLLGYIIIYYQYNIDYVIDFIDDRELTRWADSYAASQSIAIANIGLVSFLIGYIYKKEPLEETVTRYYPFKDTNILDSLMGFFLVTFVVFINKTYLFGGYGADIEMGTIAEFSSNWIQVLYISSITIKSYNYKREKEHEETYISVISKPLMFAIFYIMLILMSGARYEALRVILVSVIAYIYSTRVILPKSLVLIVGLSAAVLFSLIGLMRGVDNSSNIDQAYDSMMEVNTIFPLTKELAFSYNTLLIAVRHVPETFPYNFGLTFFPLLLYLIPGGRGLFLRVFDIPPMLESSSMFITFLGLDGFDWGLGSSSLADVYVSFGVYGIVVLFCIFGYLIRHLEVHTFIRSTTSPYVLAFSFSFFSQIIFINRESLLTSLIGMSYVLIIIYLFRNRQEEEP